MDEDDIGVAFLLKFSKTKFTILIHKNGKQNSISHAPGMRRCKCEAAEHPNRL
jgi:hypothetical protein